jgi:predicted DNA-binding protein
MARPKTDQENIKVVALLPKEVHEQLKEVSQANGLTVSAYVRMATIEKLRSEK